MGHEDFGNSVLGGEREASFTTFLLPSFPLCLNGRVETELQAGRGFRRLSQSPFSIGEVVCWEKPLGFPELSLGHW